MTMKLGEGAGGGRGGGGVLSTRTGFPWLPITRLRPSGTFREEQLVSPLPTPPLPTTLPKTLPFSTTARLL